MGPDHSRLPLAAHALPGCLCHPGTPVLSPATSPAQSVSAYVIGPSFRAGSVVIGGRGGGRGGVGGGAAAMTNQKAAFDSEQPSANTTTRRHFDTSRSRLIAARKHTPQRT